LVLAAALAGGCEGEIGGGVSDDVDVPRYSPGGLRVLTPAQYRNTVRDLLGADAAPVGQWRSSIAAAQGGVALAAVEAYEEEARATAAWVFGDAGRRSALVGCDPVGSLADECRREFLGRFGRQAFRRPLTGEEVDRYAAVAASAGETLGDGWRGLELGVVAVLQAPSFLYRVELGEPDPDEPSRWRFSSYEMASRLSFFVTNSAPDATLLDAAERGDLLGEAGIRRELRRLLASDRGRAGMVHFFSDLLDLDALATLDKDKGWLPQFTPTLGPALRDQLLMTIDDVVFRTGDYRELFVTRRTFMNDELARFYGVDEDFGFDLEPVTFPEDGPRAGLLTLGGLLALHAGQADTAPTLRGKFVRTVLLCQSIPPPPPDIDTTIPEPQEGELVTTRDLLARHREDPSCASCHGMMDPIGLGLENFDAIGAYREKQNGITIDASGELDGQPFADAVELGQALADHEALAECLVKSLYRYAAGRVESARERHTINEVSARFENEGQRVEAAFEALALSAIFRYAAPLPAEEP
jgi:hypothetical protein